jgi:ABC-type sugar transport system permease subunit
MTWSSPHFLQVLLSPEHGFLLWTPLAVLALAGLAWLAAARGRDLPPESRYLAALMLLLVVLQVYINGCVESWTVAGSFGQRRFVALTPLLAVGLAGVDRAWSPRHAARAALAALVIAAVWWNVGLMAQFGLHTMDRQRLTPAANARATFIDLPLRAPSLAWRYVTDRSSFYGLPRR